MPGAFLYVLAAQASGLRFAHGQWLSWNRSLPWPEAADAISALAAAICLVVLVPLMPRVFAFATGRRLADTNRELEPEVAERKRAEAIFEVCWNRLRTRW
jgi:hypothetical protein